MTIQNLAKILLSLFALLLLLACIAIVVTLFRPPKADRNDLFTKWQDDRLYIAGVDGRWLVTHLENLTNHSIAMLPEPIFVVESGGISISASNLAKLAWKLPAQPFDNPFSLQTVPPPSTNIPVQALYIPMARAKFVR